MLQAVPCHMAITSRGCPATLLARNACNNDQDRGARCRTLACPITRGSAALRHKSECLSMQLQVPGHTLAWRWPRRQGSRPWHRGSTRWPTTLASRVAQPLRTGPRGGCRLGWHQPPPGRARSRVRARGSCISHRWTRRSPSSRRREETAWADVTLSLCALRVRVFLDCFGSFCGARGWP